MADETKDNTKPGNSAGNDSSTGDTGSTGSQGNQADDAAQWKQLEDTIERVTGKVIEERLSKWQPPTIPAALQSGPPEGQTQSASQEQGEGGKTRSQQPRKKHWLENLMNWPGPTNLPGT